MAMTKPEPTHTHQAAAGATPRTPQERLEEAMRHAHDMVTHAEAEGYAKGFRRAAHLLSIMVGQLDGQSKALLTHSMNQLEDELHRAENAAKK